MLNCQTNIDIPDLAQRIRDEWMPKGMHNNADLDTILKNHFIQILYSNSTKYDGYLKVKHGTIQMILTRKPKQKNREAFFNYTMAHLLGILVLNFAWLKEPINNEDRYVCFDSYYGSKINKKQLNKYFMHKWYEKPIDDSVYQWFHHAEIQAQIFALSFLMPSNNFDELNHNTNDLQMLANEFQVDNEIIQKRQTLSEVLQEKNAKSNNI